MNRSGRHPSSCSSLKESYRFPTRNSESENVIRARCRALYHEVKDDLSKNERVKTLVFDNDLELEKRELSLAQRELELERREVELD